MTHQKAAQKASLLLVSRSAESDVSIIQTKELQRLAHLCTVSLAMLSTYLAVATVASAVHVERTVQDLTAGWRFKRGDLPYDGGPELCSDQAHAVAYPVNLAGKACDMGARDRWAKIESGGRNNFPDDCARACCVNSNCTVWSWNNNTNKGPPLGPNMPATAYGDCYLGYGEHDVATVHRIAGVGGGCTLAAASC